MSECLDTTIDEYVSRDASMQRCLDLARTAARTNLPLLILGETGTGKTVLAGAIHRSSKRAAGPFVAFNASALSESLLDSQLFGHERGAFTDAGRTVRGKFELAHEGTIFLDEIADMSAGAQAKILRVVEYGEFERLGSEKIIRVDTRIIAATHLPIRQFVEERRFRSDLFYRLAGIILTVPPLRERPHDLEALIGAETARASEHEKKRITGFTEEALKKLVSYHWPGNLRELNRAIHTAVALTEGNIIEEDVILLGAEAQTLAVQPARIPVVATPSAHVGMLIGDARLKVAEAQHILKVLARAGGNKRQTARLLGVSRSTLERKLDQIQREENAAAEEL